MTRIRSILQQRADRFRTKQVAQKKQFAPLSIANDDSVNFTEQLVIKPQVNPDGINPDYKYSLQAVDTHGTAVETFSSGEENSAYSDENEGGEFLDLAYEASRQEINSIGGHDFIDLVEESDYNEGVRDEIAPEQFAQPDTIEFVDSEDGKVFNITKEITKNETTDHVGLLQNVRSLDESNALENDECSKTLNTNTETLQSMPSLNDDDLAQITSSNHLNSLHVDKRDEAEGYEELDLENPVAYENGDYNGVQFPVEGNSQLYDCDDGEMYYDQHENTYAGEDVPLHGYEEDGNFFEQLRNVQSRHVNDYQTHPGSMGVVEEEVQPGQWKSISNQVHFENAQNTRVHMSNDMNANHPLEDPYLSDGGSSWEEGSFATGASRTLSRVDTADDNDDDGRTYDGTFDGTEYYSDDDSRAERNDRPIVRMLKKIRENVEDDQPRGKSSDEEEDEDYNGKKKRSKNRRRRQAGNKSTSVWIMDSLREIGTDILDETIEFAESQDRGSRGQDGRHQTDTMIDSFANLFSCGGAF